MPVQQFLPDPRLQVFLDFVGQQQGERRRREEERARSRERQKKRQQTAIAIGAGALGGAFLAAPALTAGGAAGAGLAAPAAGIGGLGGAGAAGLGFSSAVAGAGSGALSGAISGGLLGGQIGSAFANDDIAGGLQGIAQFANQGGLQAQGISPLDAASLGIQGTGQLLGRSILAGNRERAFSAREQRRSLDMLARGTLGITGDELTRRAQEAGQSEFDILQQAAAQQQQQKLEFAEEKAFQTRKGAIDATLAAVGLRMVPDTEKIKLMSEELLSLDNNTKLNPTQREQRRRVLLKNMKRSFKTEPIGQTLQEQIDSGAGTATLPDGSIVSASRTFSKISGGKAERDRKDIENAVKSLAAGNREVTKEAVMDTVFFNRQLLDEFDQQLAQRKAAAANPPQQQAPSTFNNMLSSVGVMAGQGLQALGFGGNGSPAPQQQGHEQQQQQLPPDQQEVLVTAQAIGTILEKSGNDVSKWSKRDIKETKKAAPAFIEKVQQQWPDPRDIPEELRDAVRAAVQVQKL